MKAFIVSLLLLVPVVGSAQEARIGSLRVPDLSGYGLSQSSTVEGTLTSPQVAGEALLWAGLAIDMATTYRSLARPARVEYDAVELGRVQHHDVTRTFTEIGWAGKLVNPASAVQVIAANAALDVGVAYLSRKLVQKGGWWRKAGLALAAGKGVDHLVAARHNVKGWSENPRGLIPDNALNVVIH